MYFRQMDQPLCLPTDRDWAMRNIYNGVFSDEKVLQLLHILKSTSEKSFLQLKKISEEQAYYDQDESLKIFKQGLQSIAHWNEDTICKHTDSILSLYPSLHDLIRYSVTRYVQELFKNERSKRVRMEMPSTQSFIHRYLQLLAASDAYATMEVFNMGTLDKNVLFMEILRGTFIESVNGKFHLVGETPRPPSVCKPIVEPDRPVSRSNAMVPPTPSSIFTKAQQVLAPKSATAVPNTPMAIPSTPSVTLEKTPQVGEQMPTVENPPSATAKTINITTPSSGRVEDSSLF